MQLYILFFTENSSMQVYFKIEFVRLKANLIKWNVIRIPTYYSGKSSSKLNILKIQQGKCISDTFLTSMLGFA